MKSNKNENVNDLKSPAYYKISIGEKIEVIKGLIIEKLDYLQDLNESIKNDCVPVSVINNFNQSIKEIDVSINAFLLMPAIFKACETYFGVSQYCIFCV